MLLLVLHNDENFLNRLLIKVQEQGDVEASIQDNEGLGEEIVGSSLDVFSGVRWASTGNRFDHALIVVFKNREKLAELKQLVLHKMDLYHYSGKGLILSLPYASIETLKKKLGNVETNHLLPLIPQGKRHNHVIGN